VCETSVVDPGFLLYVCVVVGEGFVEAFFGPLVVSEEGECGGGWYVEDFGDFGYAFLHHGDDFCAVHHVDSVVCVVVFYFVCDDGWIWIWIWMDNACVQWIRVELYQMVGEQANIVSVVLDV
jgi:hypothetical protein